jgi:hypothetical protein
MDIELCCKTSSFDLNSNRIQMLYFKKKTKKKKGRKQKNRKGAEGTVSARARKRPKA